MGRDRRRPACALHRRREELLTEGTYVQCDAELSQSGAGHLRPAGCPQHLAGQAAHSEEHVLAPDEAVDQGGEVLERLGCQ